MTACTCLIKTTDFGAIPVAYQRAMVAAERARCPVCSKEAAMRCEHDVGACCWLCSDQVSWWREARIKAGLSAEPPNKNGRLLRIFRRKVAS
jgi:hypothetical protein